MRENIVRLSVIIIVFLVCVCFMLAIPWVIELREKQINKWATAASGSAVPAASLTSSPPPCNDTHFFSLANLNDGPGRGMKTASGSGRLLSVLLGVALVVYSVYMHLHIVTIRKRSLASIVDDDCLLLAGHNGDHINQAQFSQEADHA